MADAVSMLVAVRIVVRGKALRDVMLQAELVDAIRMGLLKVDALRMVHPPMDAVAMRVVHPKAVDQPLAVPVAEAVMDADQKGAVMPMVLRRITRNDFSNTRWSSMRTKTASSARPSC